MVVKTEKSVEEYCLMKIKLIDDCIKRTHDPGAIKIYNDYKKIFLDKITKIKELKKVELIKLKKEQEELIKKLEKKIN